MNERLVTLASTDENGTKDQEVTTLQLFGTEKYVGHASSHPRIPLRQPLTREDLAFYPEVPQEYLKLLVKLDPEREEGDGGMMLEDLMRIAPYWAQSSIEQGYGQEETEDWMVRRVQNEWNVMLDNRALVAAKAIARDAVSIVLQGHIDVQIPGRSRTIGSPLRDDVPSIVAITGPDGSRRHELFTPDQRKGLKIHRVEVNEKELIQAALHKSMTTDKTGQGE
jgi:hypothetical protein